MVLRSPPTTRRNKLSPCSHEEVDARMMVHIADAVQDGHQSVMIRSTDTDLVALVVATLDLKELWVSYGTRKKTTESYWHISLQRLLVHLSKSVSPSSMPLQGATQHPSSPGIEKEQPGQRGRTFQMLLRHFSSWQGPLLIFLRRICAP